MTTEKRYLVTTLDGKTLKGVEITLNDDPTSNNAITGIDVGNLKTQATTDVGKIWKVKADGAWELGEITQYKTISDMYDRTVTPPTLIAGNTETLYYLDTALSTPDVRAKGLYIYIAGTTNNYVACSVNGSIDVDGVTVGKNASNELCVPDGVDSATAPVGLTVAKFVPAVVRKSTETTPIRALADATDDCIATEKAIRTELNKAVPYNTDQTGTDLTFNIGWDATGPFILRETT